MQNKGGMSVVKNLENLMEEVREMSVSDMNSQGFISGYHKARVEVIGLINQIEQPELPVVPNYVAEWLEKHKEQDLYWLLNTLYQHITEIDGWFENNVEKLIYAKLYGYTIEKNKYMVKFPGIDRNGKDIYLLAKTDSDGVDWSPDEYIEAHINDYIFTEQEIRDIDAKYMAFAIPLEETSFG